MTLDTSTSIEAVEDTSGSDVPPANDAETLDQGTADLDPAADGTQTLDLDPIDAADRLTIHVEFSAAGQVDVHFTQADGTRLTSRTKGDSTDYETTGSGDVFVETAVASPHIEIEISDNSGGANSTTWSVYLR